MRRKYVLEASVLLQNPLVNVPELEETLDQLDALQKAGILVSEEYKIKDAFSNPTIDAGTSRVFSLTQWFPSQNEK